MKSIEPASSSREGQRNTPQREIIFGAVSRSKRPLCVDEIHSLASKKLSGLGIATVYRAVQRLCDQGLLKSVLFPGQSRQYFEKFGTATHDHFLCQRCERAFCISGTPMMLEQLVPSGFQLIEHQVTLSGFCRDCRTPGDAKLR
jgi:Fe2+ or Zn2+ uptake regulation protein